MLINATVLRGNLPKVALTLVIAIILIFTNDKALSTPAPVPEPNLDAGRGVCARVSAKECLEIAADAMGGRERIEAIRSVHISSINHTMLVEQSYRQDPFVVAYRRDEMTLDLANQRLRNDMNLTWPESDNGQFESKRTLIAGLGGGVYHDSKVDTPCGPGDLLEARQIMALGPFRILLTAIKASDLHYLSPEIVRSTSHSVLAFTWNSLPVRVLVNPFNGLPDVVETTQQFPDMWYFWGDVQERIYFDNWKFVQGLVMPTQLINERNGIVWRSTQMLMFDINRPIDEAQFKYDPSVAAESGETPRWNKRLPTDKAVELAAGIILYPGAWNSTVVRQDDGLVILEAPISEYYFNQVIAEARSRFPNLPIKAVLSTSDSWPHIGGVRLAVSQNLPVYILDMNRPLLERLVAAPHTILPDALSNSSPIKTSQFRSVGAPTLIGSGDNAIEIIPLRGASTERQYAAYFPARQLLYASDTLALNDDGSLYDPELMIEVSRMVKDNHLQIQKVYSMHQEPMTWSEVVRLLQKSGDK
jgi:hypothetical protein